LSKHGQKPGNKNALHQTKTCVSKNINQFCFTWASLLVNSAKTSSTNFQLFSFWLQMVTVIPAYR